MSPLARRIALRSHWRPKTSRSEPTIEPQRVDRHRLERRPERGDEDGEDDERGDRALERRPPAAGDAEGEHDRERLHHLDRAGEGGAEEDEQVAGHPATVAFREIVGGPSAWRGDDVSDSCTHLDTIEHTELPDVRVCDVCIAIEHVGDLRLPAMRGDPLLRRLAEPSLQRSSAGQS